MAFRQPWQHQNLREGEKRYRTSFDVLPVFASHTTLRPLIVLIDVSVFEGYEEHAQLKFMLGLLDKRPVTAYRYSDTGPLHPYLAAGFPIWKSGWPTGGSYVKDPMSLASMGFHSSRTSAQDRPGYRGQNPLRELLRRPRLQRDTEFSVNHSSK